VSDTTRNDKLVRPNDVAERLGVDGKAVRNFLRSEFKRDATKKNTSWYLTPDMVEAIEEHFTPEDDGEGDDTIVAEDDTAEITE
jgi:hypothetical protein